MNKLMMAAAIVCVALGVQASCADWTVMSQYSDTGASLYAVNAAGLAGKDLTKLTLLDVTGNAFKWSDGAGGYVDHNTMGAVQTTASKTSLTTLADANLSASSSIYWVLVKDNQYALMNGGSPYDVPAAKIYEEGEQGKGATIINEMAVSHSYTDFSTVPEPTSGLLLLLGVAGLALRRRRA